MHIENDAVRGDTDDLDAFDALFNSTSSDDEPKAPDGAADDGVEDEPAELEDQPSEDEDEDVEDEDDSGDDDSPATDEDEDDDEEPEEKPRKKLTARERVEQAIARQREAERERDELRIQLELAKKNTKEESAPTPTPETKAPALSEQEPRSDAVDENGEPLYPLGDLDPSYIRDLTKWANKMAFEELRAEEEAAKRQREQEEANRQLVENWQAKLQEAEADLPDVRKKGEKLEQTFRDIDPNYGQALAATIMSLDYGPHVLDYLADNIQEAQEIVNSDPLKAVLKLGSLNERLSMIYAKGDTKPKKKVSSAPPPAPSNKGAMRTKQIRPDTDNLDDFDKLFNQR